MIQQVLQIAINKGMVAPLAFLVIITIVLLVTLFASRRGMYTPKLRRLPPLDAIEEAVGRATEMGRPIIYGQGLAGLADENAAQTVAGLSVLGYTAELAAKYGARLIYCVYDPSYQPLVYEIIQQAHVRAGHPETFNADDIIFLGNDQFPWAFGVVGLVHREKAAACIYMGAFWAESLILAETGYYGGAIQIAGTANRHQIQFFVAACDYALIGEELLAAGAYLSKDPTQIGSIWGQDMGRIIALVVLIVGSIIFWAGVTALNDFLKT